MEDADSKRWPESKWRCLKVRWDETSTIPRPERVSPWKIEPALMPPTLNPLPVSRPKRPRSSVLPASPDSSVLTREGQSKTTIDPSPASAFPRVLQGQESLTLRSAFPETNESDSSDKPFLWNPPLDDDKIDVSTSRRYGSDKWLPLGRAESSFTDLLSGFGSHVNSPRDLYTPRGDQSIAKRQMLEHEAKFSLIGNNWSLMPSNNHQTRGDVRYGGFREFSMNRDNQQGNWLMPPPVLPYLHSPHAQWRDMMPNSYLHMQQNDVIKPKEVNPKLFGFSLISSSPLSDQPVSNRNSMVEPSGHIQHGINSHQSPAFDSSDQRSDQPKGSKMVDNPIVTSEPEKQSQPKGHSGSTRSCTKVHKQGSALGRSVDLARFNNYDELIAELDSLFEFNNELKAKNKNWLVVYTDDEDDMMLVGDDPWEEFCGMVRKISILTKEEVQRMNPGSFNSKGEEISSVAQGLDAKEAMNEPE